MIINALAGFPALHVAADSINRACDIHAKDKGIKVRRRPARCNFVIDRIEAHRLYPHAHLIRGGLRDGHVCKA